jgi:hypothetical protein
MMMSQGDKKMRIERNSVKHTLCLCLNSLIPFTGLIARKLQSDKRMPVVFGGILGDSGLKSGSGLRILLTKRLEDMNET